MLRCTWPCHILHLAWIVTSWMALRRLSSVLQAGTRQAGRSPHASDTGEQPLLDTQKYARRTGPLQRLAQRLLPQSLLSAPLPFTRQCATAEPAAV